MRTGSEGPNLLPKQTRGEKMEGDLVVGFVETRCSSGGERFGGGLPEQMKGEKKRREIWWSAGADERGEETKGYLVVDYVAGGFCPSMVIGLWKDQRNERERGEGVRRMRGKVRGNGKGFGGYEILKEINVGFNLSH
ncbi:hypothetical protein HAX54_005413 [Datura stramonium]|uniref:Uncharacterized protein n=1 Tax=Datura stramonium TaxID=4076 RepID=A0ABS8WTG0_DATST|nr:hypothetical protein [Datura stramonium]